MGTIAGQTHQGTDDEDMLDINKENVPTWHLEPNSKWHSTANVATTCPVSAKLGGKTAAATVTEPQIQPAANTNDATSQCQKHTRVLAPLLGSPVTAYQQLQQSSYSKELASAMPDVTIPILSDGVQVEYPPCFPPSSPSALSTACSPPTKDVASSKPIETLRRTCSSPGASIHGRHERVAQALCAEGLQSPANSIGTRKRKHVGTSQLLEGLSVPKRAGSQQCTGQQQETGSQQDCLNCPMCEGPTNQQSNEPSEPAASQNAPQDLILPCSKRPASCSGSMDVDGNSRPCIEHEAGYQGLSQPPLHSDDGMIYTSNPSTPARNSCTTSHASLIQRTLGMDIQDKQELVDPQCNDSAAVATPARQQGASLADLPPQKRTRCMVLSADQAGTEEPTSMSQQGNSSQGYEEHIPQEVLLQVSQSIEARLRAELMADFKSELQEAAQTAKRSIRKEMLKKMCKTIHHTRQRVKTYATCKRSARSFGRSAPKADKGSRVRGAAQQLQILNQQAAATTAEHTGVAYSDLRHRVPAATHAAQQSQEPDGFASGLNAYDGTHNDHEDNMVLGSQPAVDTPCEAAEDATPEPSVNSPAASNDMDASQPLCRHDSSRLDDPAVDKQTQATGHPVVSGAAISQQLKDEIHQLPLLQGSSPQLTTCPSLNQATGNTKQDAACSRQSSEAGALLLVEDHPDTSQASHQQLRDAVTELLGTPALHCHGAITPANSVGTMMEACSARSTPVGSPDRLLDFSSPVTGLLDSNAPTGSTRRNSTHGHASNRHSAGSGCHRFTQLGGTDPRATTPLLPQCSVGARSRLGGQHVVRGLDFSPLNIAPGSPAGLQSVSEVCSSPASPVVNANTIQQHRHWQYSSSTHVSPTAACVSPHQVSSWQALVPQQQQPVDAHGQKPTTVDLTPHMAQQQPSDVASPNRDSSHQVVQPLAVSQPVVTCVVQDISGSTTPSSSPIHSSTPINASLLQQGQVLPGYSSAPPVNRPSNAVQSWHQARHLPNASNKASPNRAEVLAPNSAPPKLMLSKAGVMRAIEHSGNAGISGPSLAARFGITSGFPHSPASKQLRDYLQALVEEMDIYRKPSPGCTPTSMATGHVDVSDPAVCFAAM